MARDEAWAASSPAALMGRLRPMAKPSRTPSGVGGSGAFATLGASAAAAAESGGPSGIPPGKPRPPKCG
jgi:hypothetical protein